MQYYRDLFHEYLDSDGKVPIGSFQYDPSEILKKVDEQAYDISFNEWQTNRNEELISKANDMLDRFELQGRFSRLKTAYINKYLIPFVGAGMSVSSGYPAWRSFLWKLRKQTKISDDEINSLLVRGKFEEAAQLLADNMPYDTFNENVENDYGIDHSISGPVSLIPNYFGGPIVTTNFDSVLKRCFEILGKPFQDIITNSLAEEVTRCLGRGEHVLVQLHGNIKPSRGRILTQSEYDLFYSDPNKYKTVISAFCNVSLLFMGCSLTIDRTLQAMADYCYSVGHDRAVRHYAFLRLRDGEDQLARQNQLAKSNIYPIWYDDGEHDESIEAFLLKLAE